MIRDQELKTHSTATALGVLTCVLTVVTELRRLGLGLVTRGLKNQPHSASAPARPLRQPWAAGKNDMHIEAG
jgi:hypothetical protein